jgi:hypothetical protein
LGSALIAVVVGVIGSIVFLAFWLDKKRTQAMHAFAERNGFRVDGDILSFEEEMQPYKLFNQGHARTVKRLIRGERGENQVAICDYQYTTGGGKQSHTWVQTICVVTSAKRVTPHFYLRRQLPFFDFVGKMFGGQDVNFDQDPAFSQAFVLQTVGDEDELRRHFDLQVRSHFVELAAKNLQVEGLNGTLLVHYGTRLKIEQIPGLIDDAQALARTLS